MSGQIEDAKNIHRTYSSGRVYDDREHTERAAEEIAKMNVVPGIVLAALLEPAGTHCRLNTIGRFVAGRSVKVSVYNNSCVYIMRIISYALYVLLYIMS